ncbi:MAG: inorganic phosphate transporter [Alphaproteobacteria bacterium]|nr:inorganic phosphate transporter [Alphaproteobacteria bacterium]
MDITFLFFLSSGLFLGWSLGANDASNIFGTAVGTKMVSFRTAAVISSIFIIIGAVYAGSGTSQTLGHLGSINTLAGAFMAALAAAITIFWMVELSMPISTSQAIVGAIIGWNFFAGKPTDITILTQIVGTWVICPILSGIIAIFLYYLIRLIIRKSHTHLLRQDTYTRIGLIIAGAFGAYALGANNIANVMGVFVPSSPLKDVNFGWGITLNGTQVLFLIGSIAISIGVATYSQKVMNTVGNSIMKMSPLMAWVVVVAQSLVLFLFASQNLKHFLLSHNLPSLPLVPVSSSQAVIGAVMGIGLARGGKNLHWDLIGKIAIGWIATPIIAAGLCYISLFFLQNVFGQVVFLP